MLAGPGRRRCRGHRAEPRRCRRRKIRTSGVDRVRPRHAEARADRIRSRSPPAGGPRSDRPRSVPPRRPPRTRDRRRPRPRPRDGRALAEAGAAGCHQPDAGRAPGSRARDRGRHGPARPGLRRATSHGGRGRAPEREAQRAWGGRHPRQQRGRQHPRDGGGPSESDWDTVVDTNLKAPFLCARAFGPAMCARGWGRVINRRSMLSVDRAGGPRSRTRPPRRGCSA